MEHKLLVLCDPEEDYAQQMSEYLRKKKEASWEIYMFTDPVKLVEFAQTNKMEILLIAESAYGEFVSDLPAELIILLNESGLIQKEGMVNIDKYQEAEKVRQQILACYVELEKEFFPRLKATGSAKLIGMYSPVRRCLQTTFALTYGQLLAQQHRTLYISFERYGSFEEWQDTKRQDLCSLLYFQQEEESVLIHLQAMVQRFGNLEYVVPMLNGENLLYVTLKEWQKLLQSITESGEYEYVILDLSEGMQGLFEILRMCNKIYTIVKEDAGAKKKILQYEQLLSLQEYEDVKSKTAQCNLPIFRKLPEEIEQYTKGELADYIRGMLRRENV